MTLLLKLSYYLLQLLRLCFFAGQILDAVVLDGNCALQNAVVVLQLCQLRLHAVLRYGTTLQTVEITHLQDKIANKVGWPHKLKAQLATH